MAAGAAVDTRVRLHLRFEAPLPDTRVGRATQQQASTLPSWAWKTSRGGSRLNHIQRRQRPRQRNAPRPCAGQPGELQVRRSLVAAAALRPNPRSSGTSTSTGVQVGVLQRSRTADQSSELLASRVAAAACTRPVPTGARSAEIAAAHRPVESSSQRHPFTQWLLPPKHDRIEMRGLHRSALPRPSVDAALHDLKGCAAEHLRRGCRDGDGTVKHVSESLDS